jgi:hypothetical protein
MTTRHELLTADGDWFEGPATELTPDLSGIGPTGKGHPQARAEIAAIDNDNHTLKTDPHGKAIIEYLARLQLEVSAVIDLLSAKTGYSPGTILVLVRQVEYPDGTPVPPYLLSSREAILQQMDHLKDLLAHLESRAGTQIIDQGPVGFRPPPPPPTPRPGPGRPIMR